MKIRLESAEETIKLGEKLGKLLGGGDVVALVGQLGSGKTTLVKGIASGTGVEDARHLNSPSFVILKEYSGRVPLYHFDIYRLNDPCELDTVGYKDYFYGNGVSVVEWADKIEDIMPEEYLQIKLVVVKEDVREAELKAKGTQYESLLQKF